MLNVKCKKTKTKAILNQVVALHAITTIDETLINILCISVATDASNHGAVKKILRKVWRKKTS